MDNDTTTLAPAPEEAADDRSGGAGRSTVTLRPVVRRRAPREPRRPAAPMPPEAAFDWLPHLGDFVARRWRWIAAPLAMGVTLALALGLARAPRFTAETQLMVDLRRADQLSQQPRQQDAETLNAELESRVEILRSAGLARSVAARPFAQSLLGRHGDEAAERLMRMTNVRRIGLTYVIDVAVTAGRAMDAAALANGLVDAYVDGQMAAQDQATGLAGTWLQKRLAELRTQAAAAGAAVAQFKAANNIVQTGQGLLIQQQMSELTTQLAAVEQKAELAKTRAARMRAGLQGDLLDAGMDSDLQSPVINTLRATYLDDQARAAIWAASYGADHVQVRKLRLEMVQIRNAIRAELQRAAAAADNEYAVARDDADSLRARLAQSVGRAAATDRDQVTLSALQSSAATYRSIYENFLSRYTQAVQDESFPVSEVRVISRAQPPLHRAGPGRILLTALGAIGGLAAGLGVAVAAEALDQRIRNEPRLQIETGLPCLGHLPPGAPLAGAPAGAAYWHGRAWLDGLRAIGMRLQRAAGSGSMPRLIGFVSAGAQAGGSMASLGFARMLAESGERTLLIRFAEPAHRRPSCGVMRIVANPLQVTQFIERDDPSGLDILPVPQDRHRLVFGATGAAARKVLADLLSIYDYVIADLPRLSPATEPHRLSRELDAVVLLVPWNQLRSGALRHGMEASGLYPQRFAGAVFYQG